MEAILPNQKLLSIISASNRPHHMSAFLENLNETVANPHSIEVLVKIDDGDQAMYELMEDAIKRYPFLIRYIQTLKLDGYYTLHYGYQQLLEMSDSRTYFIFPVNEEVRFKTKGWDNILRQYVGFFSDDVFRLKISRLKFRNYYSYHDCGPTPENYPILTRKWVELAEGIGDCWGPDGWHQFIDYHLGKSPGINHIPGLFRSVPIIDILIEGEEAGKELTSEQSKKRSYRIAQEWWRMYSPAMQQRFRRLAIKIFSYVWAHNEKLDHFELMELKETKAYYVMHHGQSLAEFRYFLSPSYIRYKNFCFLMNKARNNNFGFLETFIFHSEIPSNIILKYIDRIVRIITVSLAVVMGYLIKSYESIPGPLWQMKNFICELIIFFFGEARGRAIIHGFKINRINLAFSAFFKKPGYRSFIRAFLIICLGFKRSEQVIQFIKSKVRNKNAV